MQALDLRLPRDLLCVEMKVSQCHQHVSGPKHLITTTVLAWLCSRLMTEQEVSTRDESPCETSVISVTVTGMSSELVIAKSCQGDHKLQVMQSIQQAHFSKGGAGSARTLQALPCYIAGWVTRMGSIAPTPPQETYDRARYRWWPMTVFSIFWGRVQQS